MFNEIKNVVFDLDNTLYDFSGAWLRANEETFYYFGYDKLTDYDTFFEMYRKHNFRLIKEIQAGNLRLRQLRVKRIIDTLKELGYSMTREESDSYYKKQFEIIEDNIKPDKKLISNLKKLKEHYNLILLTNGKSKEQRRKIAKLGFDNLFTIYISEETWFDKPEQAAFFNVLDSNRFLASETLMVGDSLFHDIKPAEKLGFKTCLINRKWHFDIDNKNDSYKGCKVSDASDIINILLTNKFS